MVPDLINNLGGVYTQRATDFARKYYDANMDKSGEIKGLSGAEKYVYHAFGQDGLNVYNGLPGSKSKGVEALVRWANDSKRQGKGKKVVLKN